MNGTSTGFVTGADNREILDYDGGTGAVALAYWWSHLRRPFYEIAAGGNAPIAAEALRRIAQLYAIEAELRGRDADARRDQRQARSRPLCLRAPY